jgi:glucan phosphoethanolaminetransferase (alkaline phosphatase superfamily)
MAFVIPQEELAVGFAHGMHWATYLVQTIALLGIVFVAGLLGLLFWRSIARPEQKARERAWSGRLGLVTAVVGVAFVWFLWYWNLIGYQF